MSRSARRRHAFAALLAALAAVVLGACRVDVAVDVEVAEDGSGTVTLTVVADEAVVAAAPGLAQDLRLDDMLAAGWQTEGPEETDGGGLRIVLVRPFASADEASAVLASLSGPDGPFQDVGLVRTEDDDGVRFRLGGVGRVDAGLAVFADPDLLAAVGATPYADEVAAAGRSPSEAVGITLRVDLPGSIDETTATNDEGPPTWIVPLDGSSVDLATTSSGGDEASVWGVVATVALVALVVWAIAATTFVVLVVQARRQRRLRRLARAARAHPTVERSGTHVDDVALDDDATGRVTPRP